TCIPVEGAHNYLVRGSSVHGYRYLSRQASPKSRDNTMEHDLLEVGAWAASAIPDHEATVSDSVQIGTSQDGIKSSLKAKSILCNQYVHDITLPTGSPQFHTTAISYVARRRISLEQHVRLERRRVEYGMLERYLEEASGSLVRPR
ncbi:hypothetical protein QBC41DRAFT_236934, partial [Cercophora samala]